MYKRQVIDIPEIERYERPDVAQSLDVETEGFLPGFTVTIPEVLELRRKYDLLELLLLDGEEKTLLWECAGDDLDELVKDKLCLLYTSIPVVCSFVWLLPLQSISILKF